MPLVWVGTLRLGRDNEKDHCKASIVKSQAAVRKPMPTLTCSGALTQWCSTPDGAPLPKPGRNLGYDCARV